MLLTKEELKVLRDASQDIHTAVEEKLNGLLISHISIDSTFDAKEADKKCEKFREILQKIIDFNA